MFSSAEYTSCESLAETTLLCVCNRMLVTNEAELGNSVWVTLKKMGLKSLCVIPTRNDVNRHWCAKMKSLGIIDEYNADTLFHEKEDGRSVQEISTGIINWLQERNVKVNAGCFFGDFSAVVGAYLCEELGIPGNSYESTKVAYLKDATQQYVLRSPQAAKYGVPSYSVNTKEELLAALDKLTLPVVMKPVCGSGAVGCKVLYNKADSVDFFDELSRGMACGTATFEKLAYSQSVIVMEFLQGIKFEIELVMWKGRLVGSSIGQRGPAPLPYFWGTSFMMPGGDSDKERTELTEAAYQCSLAVGLRQGVFNVEFIRKNGDATPKLIEINARPGCRAVNDVVKAVYGYDNRVVHALICCGVELDPDQVTFGPRTYAVRYYLDGHRNREAMNTAYGHMLSNAKEYDVKMLNIAQKTMAEIMYEKSNILCPVLAVMTTDDSRATAITKLCRFLVDSKFFGHMEEALSQF